MNPEIFLYDHTIKRFLNGDNSLADVFKINLYSSFTFNATAQTKAAAETGGTQVSTANGYTQDAAILASVTVNTANTTDAFFTAAFQSWMTTGGSLSASWAMCYNDTDANDPPVFAVDFKGTQTAPNGVPFVIVWPAEGIITAKKKVIV
jgi:hypothetical protein